jgi:hypothetical protein
MPSFARLSALRIECLVTQLRAFGGYRTLWLREADGEVVHTEPDEELEHLGHRYLATVWSPDADALGRILGEPAASPSRTAVASHLVPAFA